MRGNLVYSNFRVRVNIAVGLQIGKLLPFPSLSPARDTDGMFGRALQIPRNGFNFPLQHLDETSVLSLMATTSAIRYAIRFTSHRLVSSLFKHNKDTPPTDLSERDISERKERDQRS